MKTLSIAAITNSAIWVASADGQKVFDQLFEALAADEKVELSFAGRERVITAFLNVAIGQLYAGRIPESLVENNLKFIDLGDGDQEKIDLVVSNAKRFFAERRPD